MKLILIALITASFAICAAKGPKTSKRKVAANGKVAVSDYQPEAETCGTLQRIRYETHNVTGLSARTAKLTVLKLLIGNIYIKFYSKNLTVDGGMLATALNNKAIKTCYGPDTGDDQLGAYLDFYVAPEPEPK